ncbi:MAG TPA: bifunctional ADP-dependent NAD(P)H-hydrate dehydratase/NAD(P)H-hydrate epimerase, partial [Gaiellaceae bacterium]
MLEPLYTAAEMRAAEERYPGSVDELMDRAGRAVARHALEDFGNAQSFTVVCGGGSNGGDGRVAARVLEDAGRDVLVVDAKPEDEEKDLGDPDVVIDALFGTGFEGEPRPGAARLIEQMNDLGAPVLSVDLPSGVDASTGEVAGAAVDADLTVTFHGEKVGHYVTPGAFLAGYVEVEDIGLEPQETESGRVTRSILDLLPRRSPEGNKYESGHVVVAGGSPGMTGAPCLSALAAFRADAGYVTLCGPAPAIAVFEHVVLEAVKRSLPADGDGFVTEDAAQTVLDLVERAGALAVGPGLGRS